MGNWHAQDEGNKERRNQQEKPAGGEGGAVARSATEGLSNKGLQGVLPGLHLQLKGAAGGAVLDESIARAIHSKRGNGEQLDASAAGTIGKSMGQDFSDVTIHRDSESDQLNKQVSAEAFTTGKDIFFREGKYDPVSNEGQKLLAHELTHVVQQRDAPPASELRVSDPNEASEQQAKSVAETVTSPAGSASSAGAGAGPSSVGREEEEAATSLDRQAMHHGEEEEKSPYGSTNMATSLAREAEEDEMATSVQREAEEDEMAMSVQREGEEDEMAMSVQREAEEDEMAMSVQREGEEDELAMSVARQESEGEEEEGMATQLARHEAEDDHAGHAHG